MDSLLAFFSINQWLGEPELASNHAATISNMLELVHWFMLVLFVFWFTFFVFVLIRFNRRKNPKANYHGMTSHFSTHMEVGVVVVEVVLLLFFAFPLWSARVDEFPEGGKVAKVRAVGEQYRWTYHYPGKDGLFGMVSPNEMSGSNPIGLIMDDPNAQDDFIAAELQLPKDRQVVVQVTSKDVIHNLALIPMWIQADAIPGTEIPMWFVPNRTGEWDIVCAQLCGAGHAKMVGKLVVVEAEEFDAWADQRSDSSLQMNAPREAVVAVSQP